MGKQKKTGKKSGKAVVYLIGDSPLVEEYADLCLSKGYGVVAQWNSGKKGEPTEKYRKSSVVPAGTSLALELTNTDTQIKRKNLERLDAALPATSLLLSTSVIVTATEQAGWIQKKHRLAGFGALPGFSTQSLVEVAPTVFTPAETFEVARTFFRSIGKEMEIIQDRVGMVLPRIVCQIINESVFALQDDVASPGDIDTAMRLGVNYPLGPIEWADRIGFGNVYAVLSALEKDLREDRYRIAPLLKQMAESGDWWKLHSAKRAAS